MFGGLWCLLPSSVATEAIRLRHSSADQRSNKSSLSESFERLHAHQRRRWLSGRPRRQRKKNGGAPRAPVSQFRPRRGDRILQKEVRRKNFSSHHHPNPKPAPPTPTPTPTGPAPA